jgi:integrase
MLVLSVLFHHGLRREEVCSLRVSSMHQRRGVPHLRIHSGHAHDKEGALFRPIRNNRTGTLDRPLSPDGVYKIMRACSAELGPAQVPMDNRYRVHRPVIAAGRYSRPGFLSRSKTFR